jgi:carbamoyltransferase
VSSDRPVVLGLNAFGHDAAAVLLRGGEAVFAASEERFDRVRHSAAFPRRGVAAALAAAGLSPSDVDAVAFPWSRGMGRARKALHLVRGLPRSLAYLREPPDDLLPDRRGYLRAMRGLEAEVAACGVAAPVVRVPHHLAHAVSAALALPGARGAVLTADGMGEWTTAATWHVVDGRPRRLREARYPHSAGKAYAAVTRFLGFRPESDEGKTMGLAGYGSPDAPAARFSRAALAPEPRRLLRVDLGRFGFPWGEARLYGDAFLRAVGPPRRPDEALRPSDADLARGIQDAVEAFALAAARGALEETGAAALGLAGGLFLNCAMNGALLRALPVPVCPFPVAGDAGAAWGAAAWVHALRAGGPALPLSTLRLGTRIADADAEAALAGRPSRRLETRDLAREVAALVARGALVGVARGRAELGPRALGGRSVLSSPADPAVRDRVNDRKGRERWRPLAPVVREEDAGRWFSPAVPSPWMILTLVGNDRARAEVPGALHVDGTARVQTVARDGDDLLRGVLDALPSLGHPPCVLNTSLNRRGEPIVDSAPEALAAAQAMHLDALVLADRLCLLSSL